MTDDTGIYCPVCFALPGEACRSKFVVRETEPIPVRCKTHDARMLGNPKHAVDHSFAVQLLAAALIAYRGN